jgi:hypothetical protein
MALARRRRCARRIARSNHRDERRRGVFTGSSPLLSRVSYRRRRNVLVEDDGRERVSKYRDAASHGDNDKAGARRQRAWLGVARTAEHKIALVSLVISSGEERSMVRVLRVRQKLARARGTLHALPCASAQHLHAFITRTAVNDRPLPRAPLHTRCGLAHCIACVCISFFFFFVLLTAQRIASYRGTPLQHNCACALQHLLLYNQHASKTAPLHIANIEISAKRQQTWDQLTRK